jgi:hypothetical protein
VSIGTAPGEPMVSEDTFDRDWAAARGGTLEGPASQPVSGDGTPEPSAPATPDAGQFGTASPAPASSPVAAQAPSEPVQQPFALPDQYQQRLREVGAASLDDALTMARQFQSVRGQLPNLEQHELQQMRATVQQQQAQAQQSETEALKLTALNV